MYEFYVTIAGAKQGQFTGEAAGKHAGKLVGLAYEQETSAAAGAGRAAAKVTLGPVRFTRQWGPASPQILQALATGEALTKAVFEFVRTTDEGVEQVFQRVELFGARVVGHRPFIELEAEPASLMPLPPLEEVALAFTGLEVTNVPTGITTLVGTKPKAVARAAPRKAGAARRR